MMVSSYKDVQDELEVVYVGKGIPCYRDSDLHSCFSDEQNAAFDKWFFGQTGAISEKGEPLVYVWDVERFFIHLGGG